jgi:Tol biopolymer transport system component
MRNNIMKNRNIFNLLILFFVVAITTISCTFTSLPVSSPTSSPDLLIFSKKGIFYDSRVQGIVNVDPVTGNSSPLTDEEKSQFRLSTSPNGLRIICCEQIGFEPYQTNGQETIVESVPWDEAVFEAYTAQWSSSGEKMIVGVQIIGDASQQLGRFALYALDRHTLDFSLIGNGLIPYFASSSINDHVAMVKVQSETGKDTEEVGLYIVDLANYSRERLLEEPYIYNGIESLVLSPDGKRLAISHFKAFDIVNVDGSELSTLLESPLLIPTWSPDGRWVAGVVSLNSSPPRQLVILDTKSDRKIVTGDSVSSFVWSHDSTQIAFIQPTKDRNNVDDLSVITLSDEQVRTVLQGPRSLRLLVWF